MSNFGKANATIKHCIISAFRFEVYFQNVNNIVIVMV